MPIWPALIRPNPKPWARAGLAALALATCSVQAVELETSVFGTLGYARSNSSVPYQRDIDRGGTLRRDSVLGLQADWKFSHEWSATAQMRLGRNLGAERGYEGELAWGFAAWRPNNDWLVRVGKFRVPLYLHSQILDVGVATPYARMPQEVYSASPTDDFKGVYVTRTINTGAAEWNVEGIAGRARPPYRTWLRDGIPGALPAGALYIPIEVEIVGFAANRSDADTTWRASVFSARTVAPGRKTPVRPPFVSLAPGVGFYVVDPAFGPVETAESVVNTVTTIGADWRLSPRWQLSGEFLSNRQHQSDLGAGLYGAYASLIHRADGWSPYVYVARAKMREPQASFYRGLTQPTLPSTAFPLAGLLNAAQRVAGETGIFALDQRTFAVGATWRLSEHAALKAEMSHTRIGDGSRLVDAPPGVDVRRLRLNVLSVNYSFAF